jgi:Sensors of blue-light using FAD
MLERLIYQSTASQEFGSLGLFKLLTEAQGRNQQLDITGHLLFLNGQFTQCIEGPSASIELLWQSLQRDPRHHTIELLVRRPTQERRFSEWSMAFSTYRSLYVHGMRGFFPVDEGDTSPLRTLCSRAS